MNRTTVLRFVCAVSLAGSLTALSLGQYAGAIPPPEHLKTGFDAIDVSLAHKHLSYLAGPECAGRGSGQPGYMAAAEYVATQFRSMGIQPMGEDGSYFQNVPFVGAAPDAGATFLMAGGITAKIGSGLAVNRSGGDAAIKSSDVVFLNISEGFEGLPDDVTFENKIVFVTSKNKTSKSMNLIARKRPALTVYIEDEVGASESSLRQGEAEGGGGRRSSRGPVVTLARRYAHALATKAEIDSKYVTVGSANGAGFEYATAALDVSFNTKSTTTQVYVPNVVGVLPGSDPTLSAQYIGVGAHLDHLGERGGVVYPGADDDGSGTTAMLLLAKAVTTNPVKPKRTIVFMAFCAEEMGLIGSKYYTDNPLLPLDNMSCLLQMDMVGRNEEMENESPDDNVNTIHLIGSKRISSQLHTATIEANKYINFVFEYDEEDVYTRSDHANFAAKGVPITFLFSGFHPDYHQPTDTVDKINFEKIVSAARLNYLVLQRVAALPEMLKRDVIVKE